MKRMNPQIPTQIIPILTLNQFLTLMSTIELVCLVPAVIILFLFGLSSLAPHMVDTETKQILLCNEEYYPQETVLHKTPKNIKEYTLNDGSSIVVDTTETEVQEKEVFDPFGFEVPDQIGRAHV